MTVLKNLLSRLEIAYRRSKFFRAAFPRRIAKAPLRMAIGVIECALRFRTAPWDALPYRFRFLTQRDEIESLTVLRSVCVPGQVALDIGAHVGYFSWIFSKLLGPQGRVYAFEPNSESYAILKSNAIRLPNVEVANVALGKRTERGTLCVPKEGSMLGYVDASSTPHGSTVEEETKDVQIWNGTDFMRKRDVNHIDLLKVDVEGAECDVLEGLNSLLQASDRVFAVVELNPTSIHRFGRQAYDLFSMLWELRFSTIECGKFTSHSRILKDADVNELTQSIGGSYTNLLCFKGYTEEEIAAALRHGPRESSHAKSTGA